MNQFIPIIKNRYSIDNVGKPQMFKMADLMGRPITTKWVSKK